MAAVTLRRAAFGLALVLAACGGRPAEPVEPVTPVMRWDHRPESPQWTEATLAALRTHGAVLAQLEPADVDGWCPAYRDNGPRQRRAFWAGLLSAIAWHESRHQPDVAGGGGRWIGLMQISPNTAGGFGCKAQSASALYDGSANMSCAVRIAASQVAKDNEIMGGPGHWRGVARDWAPFRKADKVADMRGWVSQQPYCKR